MLDVVVSFLVDSAVVLEWVEVDYRSPVSNPQSVSPHKRSAAADIRPTRAHRRVLLLAVCAVVFFCYLGLWLSGSARRLALRVAL